MRFILRFRKIPAYMRRNENIPASFVCNEFVMIVDKKNIKIKACPTG